MAREVPNVPTGLDPQTRNFFSAIREAVNQFTLNGGADSLNSNLTADNLTGIADSLDSLLSTTIPPKPTGVVVTGIFSTVMVTWNNPNYAYFSFAEIWRANAVDSVGLLIPPTGTNANGHSINFTTDAKLVGTSNGNIYTDSVTPGTKYYYWVRFLSSANIAGPYNASIGLLGSTVQDIDDLMIANGWTVQAESIWQTGQWIGNAAILNGAINSLKMADFAITEAKMADLAITTAKLNANAVTNAKIIDGAITELKIGTGAITLPKIADFAVDSTKISDLAVTTAKINNLAITSGKIVDAAITEVKVGTDAITSTKIAALAVTNAKIDNLAVTNAKIGALAVDNAKIALLAVDTTKITDAAITSAKIANLAVDNAKIALLAVDTAKIADAAIVEAKIAALAVTNAKIGNLAVTNAKIANLAVDNAKIAALAVDSAKIANAAITNAKIDNLAVDGAKIALLAVDSTKITDAAITNAKIANLAVDNAKIANLAVDTGKITNAAITNAKIANLAVSTAQIQDLAVTSAKINSLAVEKLYATAAWIASADILDGSITNAKIGNTIQSENYNGTTLGWQLSKSGGTVNLNQLTVRNAAGSIILSSGTGIPWSAVAAGSGRPADSATVGATFGSNIWGQINSSNISTYIAAAAITTAYIGDLQVNTAKINDLAVNRLKIQNYSATVLTTTNSGSIYIPLFYDISVLNMVCVWGPVNFGGGVATVIYVDGVQYDIDMPSVGYDNSGNGYSVSAKGAFSIALNPYVTHTINYDAGALSYYNWMPWAYPCPLAVFMSFK